MKDLGTLNYLGIEVISVEDGIILTQQKYIIDLLTKTNMLQCKPVSAPMTTIGKLSKFIGEPLSQTTISYYRSMAGALQYLTLIRPDMSYAVNKFYKLLQAPTKIHWIIVYRIICYLKHTSRLGLIIKKSKFIVG